MNGLALTLPPEVLDALTDQIAEKVAAQIAPPPQPFLSADQAAEYLACGRKRIYELAESGAIPSYRDGRRVLFRREDLDGYVESS